MSGYRWGVVECVEGEERVKGSKVKSSKIMRLFPASYRSKGAKYCFKLGVPALQLK